MLCTLVRQRLTCFFNVFVCGVAVPGGTAIIGPYSDGSASFHSVRILNTRCAVWTVSIDSLPMLSK